MSENRVGESATEETTNDDHLVTETIEQLEKERNSDEEKFAKENMENGQEFSQGGRSPGHQFEKSQDDVIKMAEEFKGYD